LGKKLADLDKTIKDTLPGVGTVAKRIEAAEKTLKDYKAEVDKGVEKEVGKELRSMIDGVRGEVRALTVEVANQGKNKTDNTTFIQMSRQKDRLRSRPVKVPSTRKSASLVENFLSALF